MNLLRTIANIFGYDVIRQSKDVLLERHLANLFRVHNINTVIDVGANHGQYARSLRKMKYSGEIHSFEPLSKAYAELQQLSMGDPAWHTYNHALGSAASQLDINVTSYDDFSSFLKPTDYCDDVFSYKSQIDHTELVEIKRMDHVFSQFEKNNAIHLKMDTQGFDLEVFAGVGDILNNIKSLQSEISIRQLYEGMPDYITSLQTFRDAGFNISGFFPVTRDKKDLSVIEFDCVMVKP
jgi:FkbM family methyltransferase